MISISLQIHLSGPWMFVPHQARTSTLPITPTPSSRALPDEESKSKFAACAPLEVCVELEFKGRGVLCSRRNVVFGNHATGGGEAVFAEFNLALTCGDVGARFVPALGYVAKVHESLSICVGAGSAVEID